MSDELSCGQARDWYTHTHGHTNPQTQAMTIPEGQNWPRVKTHSLKRHCGHFDEIYFHHWLGWKLSFWQPMNMYQNIYVYSVKTNAHLPKYIFMASQETWWWRHQMETFSALLAHCVGNSQVTGEFPSQRPVTRIFDGFFDLRLNKRMSKQSGGWWFETPSRSLWHHCNVKT